MKNIFNTIRWHTILLFYVITIGYLIYSPVIFSQRISVDSETIINLHNWCSKNAEYSTKAASLNEPIPSCAKNSRFNSKWFQFKASTSVIEVAIKIGGKEGTLRFPYIALWDSSFKELVCKKHLDEREDMLVKYSHLTVGNSYYLSVFPANMEAYSGSFKLCVNDEVSYDFVQGAKELKNTGKWCSRNAAFSTEGATSDEVKMDCLEGDRSNFNRWFTFRARTNFIRVTVKTGGKYGSCQRPYVALWNERLSKIVCSEKKDVLASASLITIQDDELSIGDKYYISVDHPFNKNYPGSFTLCLDDIIGEQPELVSKKNTIIGELMRVRGGPYEECTVKLLNIKKEQLGETITDTWGKFEFEGINPNARYLVKIDHREPPTLIIEIYQLNEKNEIMRRTVRIEKHLYGFEKLPKYCNQIILIDCDNVGISIQEGKTGLVGKVINRKDPTKAVVNLSVYLFDTPKHLLDSAKTNGDGGFQFIDLPPDHAYLIKFGKQKNETYAEIVRINDKGEVIMTSSSRDMDERGFFHFRKLPYLESKMALIEEDNPQFTDFSNLSIGEIIKLNNIYFNFGEYRVLKKSFKELDRLVEILIENPEMYIEVSGHTDNLGTPQINRELSANRARAVIRYLLSKGIEQGRLQYKGLGGNRPIADNFTEEGRRTNRRVEFKIIE